MNELSNVNDPTALNIWHAIAPTDDLIAGKAYFTTLMDQRLGYALDEDGKPSCWKIEGKSGVAKDGVDALPVQLKFDHIWTSLGEPEYEIFDIPEYHESDRRNLCALSVGLHTSAPRVVENFLDMGHFPFVHTDILGVEPHTEVREYDVDYKPEAREIKATNCKFYQPMASAASIGGVVADYEYRVPHPYCAILYKSSPDDDQRLDVIAVFAQPMSEERVRAHLMISVLDKKNDANKAIRLFQQTILGQDKPILENQLPRRLPLDPRAETPIRADKVSIFYRQWLRDIGLRYGTVSQAGS